MVCEKCPAKSKKNREMYDPGIISSDDESNKGGCKHKGFVERNIKYC